MIQRPQSLFLALIALAMVVQVLVPLYTEVHAGQQLVVTASAANTYVYNEATQTQGALLNSHSLWWIVALAIAAAVQSIVVLLLYKDRLRQMKLGALNSLVLAGLAISIILGVADANKHFNANFENSPELGYYLPMVALLLNMVANRLIRRDEKLVRSMDRIR